MIFMIFYGFFILVYLAVPAWVKIFLCIGNTMLPDPIPVVDEIIMWGSLVSRLWMLGRGLEWLSEHKKAIIGALVTIVVLGVICVMPQG